jgi:hypothetical protein
MVFQHPFYSTLAKLLRALKQNNPPFGGNLTIVNFQSLEEIQVEGLFWFYNYILQTTCIREQKKQGWKIHPCQINPFKGN